LLMVALDSVFLVSVQSAGLNVFLLMISEN